MKKEVLIFPDVNKPASPFNHVIKAGNTLYLTSQLSRNLKTGQIIPGDIVLQTKNAMENIKYLLENSNSSMNNILDITIYMKDISDFGKMNEVYKEYFKSGEEPARVTVQALSPIESIDIEIKVIAVTD